MVERDALVAALDSKLESALFQDYGPNGLQIEGSAEVTSIITGVTASEALLREAVRRGAQMVVVHHGLYWGHTSPVLRGGLLKRVRVCLESNLSLVAYHLPMDRHEELGNNAPALKELGATDLEPFAAVKGAKIGWMGRFKEPLGRDEFLRRVQSLYGSKPTMFLHGPAEVRTVGIVSGAGQGELMTAVNEHLDAFITGEISEHNLHTAKEEGIHHISVGHHASERMGPSCIAAWLARNFAVQAAFVDLPNPA